MGNSESCLREFEELKNKVSQLERESGSRISSLEQNVQRKNSSLAHELEQQGVLLNQVIAESEAVYATKVQHQRATVRLDKLEDQQAAFSELEERINDAIKKQQGMERVLIQTQGLIDKRRNEALKKQQETEMRLVAEQEVLIRAVRKTEARLVEKQDEVDELISKLTLEHQETGNKLEGLLGECSFFRELESGLLTRKVESFTQQCDSQVLGLRTEIEKLIEACEAERIRSRKFEQQSMDWEEKYKAELLLARLQGVESRQMDLEQFHNRVDAAEKEMKDEELKVIGEAVSRAREAVRELSAFVAWKLDISSLSKSCSRLCHFVLGSKSHGKFAVESVLSGILFAGFERGFDNQNLQSLELFSDAKLQEITSVFGKEMMFTSNKSRLKDRARRVLKNTMALVWELHSMALWEELHLKIVRVEGGRRMDSSLMESVVDAGEIEQAKFTVVGEQIGFMVFPGFAAGSARDCVSKALVYPALHPS